MGGILPAITTWPPAKGEKTAPNRTQDFAAENKTKQKIAGAPQEGGEMSDSQIEAGVGRGRVAGAAVNAR